MHWVWYTRLGYIDPLQTALSPLTWPASRYHPQHLFLSVFFLSSFPSSPSASSSPAARLQSRKKHPEARGRLECACQRGEPEVSETLFIFRDTVSRPEGHAQQAFTDVCVLRRGLWKLRPSQSAPSSAARSSALTAEVQSSLDFSKLRTAVTARPRRSSQTHGEKFLPRPECPARPSKTTALAGNSGTFQTPSCLSTSLPGVLRRTQMVQGAGSTPRHPHYRCRYKTGPHLRCRGRSRVGAQMMERNVRKKCGCPANRAQRAFVRVALVEILYRYCNRRCE